MTQIFVVEKYTIAQYATPFEKDAQARNVTIFWGRAPSPEYKNTECVPFSQGWAIALLLFYSSLFCSFQKEQQGAICSFALFQKSEIAIHSF